MSLFNIYHKAMKRKRLAKNSKCCNKLFKLLTNFVAQLWRVKSKWVPKYTGLLVGERGYENAFFLTLEPLYHIVAKMIKNRIKIIIFRQCIFSKFFDNSFCF